MAVLSFLVQNWANLLVGGLVLAALAWAIAVMIRNRTARHPVITLSDYLVYATGDETPEDYRSLIASVLQSEHGASVDPSKVEISGKIDHEHPGSYDVLFSYTNDAGLESSVILTVVVE